jgi:hypothetical protein
MTSVACNSYHSAYSFWLLAAMGLFYSARGRSGGAAQVVFARH